MLIWFVLVKWKMPVWGRVLPQRPHWSIFLFFQNSSSFTLAQSFLKYSKKQRSTFQSYRALFLRDYEREQGTAMYHAKPEVPSAI